MWPLKIELLAEGLTLVRETFAKDQLHLLGAEMIELMDECQSAAVNFLGSF